MKSKKDQKTIYIPDIEERELDEPGIRAKYGIAPNWELRTKVHGGDTATWMLTFGRH